MTRSIVFDNLITDKIYLKTYKEFLCIVNTYISIQHYNRLKIIKDTILYFDNLKNNEKKYINNKIDRAINSFIYKCKENPKNVLRIPPDYIRDFLSDFFVQNEKYILQSCKLMKYYEKQKFYLNRTSQQNLFIKLYNKR